jgi:selenocysteine-specific elongation factor
VAAHLGPPCPEDVIRVALETAAERGELEAEASGYRSPGHTARAGDPEQVRKLLQRLRDAALAPPTVEALAREGKQEIPQLRALLEHLVREGELVRVTSEFFFSRPAIDELRRRLLAHLREYGSIDPSAYKDLVGQTRKFTVPLMEYFDTEKLTIRRGNVRVLRGEGS